MWEDVNFKERIIIFWTRKKKGRHRTPRKVPMTQAVYEILVRRHAERNGEKRWIFYASYVGRDGAMKEGPYQRYRRTVLPTLCLKADVKKFTFRALRHSGASIMDKQNVPIGTIQKIPGHENRTTTEIYLHTLGNAEKEAIAIFERAMASRKNSHTDSHTGDLAKEERLTLSAG